MLLTSSTQIENTLTIAISALAQNVAACIERLPEPAPNVNYVIVIQRGSIDTTKLRKDIKVIHDDGIGVSRSRNIALSNSNSVFTLFSDDDIIFDREELIKLTSVLEKNDKNCFLLDVKLLDGTRVFHYQSIEELSKRGALLCWAVRLCVRTQVAKEIGFNEKISIGTDIPLGEETLFVHECIELNNKFYQLPLAPAQLSNDSHSGDRLSKELQVAKGIISAHIWHKNVAFYAYNLIRLLMDSVLCSLQFKPKEFLFKYVGILRYLTDSNIRKKFSHPPHLKLPTI